MLDYPQGEPGLNGIPGQDGIEVKNNFFSPFSPMSCVDVDLLQD